MSHFTTLVVGEDVDEQLEPYWELDLPKEELKEDPRAEFRVEIAEGEEEDAYRKYLKRRGKKIDECKKGGIPIPDYYQEEFKSAVDWIKGWEGYDYEKGKGWGDYHNPNAKWDWFQMGGRWTGYFKLKDDRAGIVGKTGLMTDPAKPGYVDQTRKGYVDWGSMKEEAKKRAIKNWKSAKGKNETDRHFMFGIEKGDTKESYVQRRGLVATFAVLLNGKWYERGSMGWWGCVSDEKDRNIWAEEFNKLLDSLSDETLLTVVDCHI